MAHSRAAWLIVCLAWVGTGCPQASPLPPVSEAPTASSPPAQAPATPLADSADWSDHQGWHRIGLLAEIQRRPAALAASRASERVAVLGPRGRRVTLLGRDAEPAHVLLPQDLVCVDVALDDGGGHLVLSCPAASTLLRITTAPGDATEVSRTALASGRTDLVPTPAGGVEILDALLRPPQGPPAVRGLLGASGRRYRAVRRDSMSGVIGNGEGGKSMAMLARIPRALTVEIIGMDGVAGPERRDQGWLAAWTGELGPDRRLHFVRFDQDGRVLLTTPAPSHLRGAPPEAFDLRAAVLGARDVVLALPEDGGLGLYRYVAGPDGQRLDVRLTP